MAEGKLREFSRDACFKQLSKFIERVKSVIDGDMGFELPFDIKEVFVYGSFVNSKKKKCHDVDVAIELSMKKKLKNGKILKNKGDLWEERRPNGYFEAFYNYFAKELAVYFKHPVARYYAEEECILRYLKENLNIISLHNYNSKDYEIYKEMNMKDDVHRDVHHHIVDNGKINDAEIEKLEDYRKLISYEEEKKEISFIKAPEEKVFPVLNSQKLINEMKKPRNSEYSNVFCLFNDFVEIKDGMKEIDTAKLQKMLDLWSCLIFKNYGKTVDIDFFVNSLKKNYDHYNGIRIWEKDNLFDCKENESMYFDHFSWKPRGNNCYRHLSTTINHYIKCSCGSYQANVQYFYDAKNDRYTLRVSDTDRPFDKTKNYSIFSIAKGYEYTTNLGELLEMGNQIESLLINSNHNDPNFYLDMRDKISCLGFQPKKIH